MVYLAGIEDEEIIFTHEVTITATIEKGNFEDIEEFVKNKIKGWKKVDIKSIDFENDIVEVIVYVSEPKYFSIGTIFPPPSSPNSIVASSYLLRPSWAIESEISLYLWYYFKFPKGIEIKEKMPKVEAKQVLFPEKGGKFIILY